MTVEYNISKRTGFVKKTLYASRRLIFLKMCDIMRLKGRCQNQ